MLRTIGKWLILLALLAYAALVCVWAGGEAGASRCAGIDVVIHGGRANDTVTRRGVTEELARFDGKLLGKPVGLIDTEAIERYLDGFSNFEDVECIITSSGRLRVDIVPMVPEIRVFSGSHSFYINKDGKHIPSNAEFYADVPVVSGNFSKSFSPREVLPVVRFVQADPLLRNLVTMIEANDRNNIMLVPRVRGHVVNFGDTTRLDEKRRMLLAMYRQVMPYKGWNTYDTISVKFRGQVVATRRDKTPALHAPQYVEEGDPEEAALQGQLPVDEIETAAPAAQKKSEGGGGA